MSVKAILTEQARGGGSSGGATAVAATEIRIKSCSRTTYYSDEVFDKSTLATEVDYAIEGIHFATKNLSSAQLYIKSPANGILTGRHGATDIEVGYMDSSGNEVTATQTITVTHVVSALSVPSPKKVNYVYNEPISLGATQALVTYDDGTTANVTPILMPATQTALTMGTQDVTVQYTENGRTVNGTYSINVAKAPGQITFDPPCTAASPLSISATNLSPLVSISSLSTGAAALGTSTSGTAVTSSLAGMTIQFNADGVTEGDFTLRVSVAADEHYEAATATLYFKALYWSWTNGQTVDRQWWLGLKGWLEGARTTQELRDCLGKTVSITIPFMVSGNGTSNTTSNTHSLMCVGYDCDHDKTNTSKHTLTFHTQRCVGTSGTWFGSSGARWNGSYVRSLCQTYKTQFESVYGSGIIITCSKGTFTGSPDGPQNKSPTYQDETVFLPSDCEMGFLAGASYNSGLGYAASYTEFDQYNTSHTAYQYYTSNASRIKNLNGSAVDYWERSLYDNNANFACVVISDGKPNYSHYDYSYGFAPALAV